MRSRLGNSSVVRNVVLGVSLLAVIGTMPPAPAVAGQRQFLVILANSPKQYPGPGRTPLGQPTGGLVSPELVRRQYFDHDPNNDIGSFAEYWREISYGDVTISGDVTDWIDLPWAIQPPLVDPARDAPGGSPPVNDNLANPAVRNSPANFFDLNNDGFYEYGTSEVFNNALATTPIDLDGNPGGADNGPSFVGPGSGHRTVHGQGVWKPGERFLDMNGNGRWNGLDETTNQMDFFGGPNRSPDGKPDLRGPWVDLNGDGIPRNDTGCTYLLDSDNDKNPDCCPDGPGKPGCDGLKPDGTGTDACPATQWKGLRDVNIIDCNGNLIPDACDISCTSAACLATGWTGPCVGGSKDQLPFSSQNGRCLGSTGDGIPDECQFASPLTPCVLTLPANCGEQPDPCCLTAVCVRLAGNAVRTPIARCEYDDSNASNSPDIVEPYENFMRRWDPCLFDPDVSSPNAQPSPSGHWIKVYDPNSPNKNTTLQCFSPAYTATYNDPSYIRDNYPARRADQDELIAEASERPIYGQHDPRGKITARCTCKDGSACLASVKLNSGVECFSSTDCQGGVECLKPACPPNNPTCDRTGYCAIRCTSSGDCATGATCSGGICLLPKACLAGYHSQFDPPDSWAVAVATNGPGNTTVRTTKMQAAPGVGGEAKFIVQITPEPGDPAFEPGQPQWYTQAWEDRYGTACPNPSYRDDQPTSPSNQPTVTCTAPPWTKDAGGFGSTYDMRPFRDVDVAGYNPGVNRRYFHANRGGLNGDGTGWLGCGTQDSVINFETGPLGAFGFEQTCNRPILPEETGGASKPGVFFEGWVEHDDLPSSKYHMAGDQRLGEVTSPYNNSIFGQDRGRHTPFLPPSPDNIIPAAGPYAVHVHGNLGRDAGNVLLMELLTWRTHPPFNNGDAWQTNTAGAALHPYAFFEDKGFRDYNLDGLVDQGESRYAGSENYQADSGTFSSNNGVASLYPFNRDRMVEDAVAVLDDIVDFSDFVDPVALGAVTCPGPPELPACVPVQLGGNGNMNPGNCTPVLADGVLSGIVLLPPGAHATGDFNLSPQFLPIHNEDNQDLAKKFPRNRDPATKQTVSWNLFFFNLVFSLGVSGERTIPSQDFQTAFAAHEYLHGWERFPDLYDYDVYAPEPRPVINCPVGQWDIMSGGGLVHPVPILKEALCTEWIFPVDLTTILTPGVPKAITLPTAEFVRDNSYFFLENEDRPGERYYFWSAGQGFDQRMPGEGMLMLHTDVGSNPHALPANQTNSTRPTYVIIQADGLHELEAGQGIDPACGDAGDPWPGSSNNTHFACDTNPASEWYTENACTGLEVLDIAPDDNGSMVVTFNWTPTNIPTLKFIDPPGGVTVGTPPRVIYNVRSEATDVYGGTWIRFFYTSRQTATPTPADGTLIKTVHKTTPGTNEVGVDWNIVGIPDGRYYLFADLIPDQGAGGHERSLTTVRAGRNNLGTATLTAGNVAVNISTITNGTVSQNGTARLETWTIRCVDATVGTWVVGSSVTQPLPLGEPNAATCTSNPTLCATTGTQYTSVAGAVKFTIQPGAGSSPKGAVGDTFTFTTTGITAPSAGVTIRDGQVREDPTAIIDASPLSGPPPLKVDFDARRSIDPNGQPLQFAWTFGDGAAAAGPTASHTFKDGKIYTVTLRATNPANGRFGTASVDIAVTNNSPKAVIEAAPTSGQGPLDVHFSSAQSSDAETPGDQLVYQWNYGDGVTANDQGTPGILRSPVHTYARHADGTLCTSASPCNFMAVLKVTDGGGKTDSASLAIRVGNTNPVAVISSTVLVGASPFTVTFNAKNSTDAENDNLQVEWIWGDGSPNEKWPAKTGKPPATDGSVPHTFTLPADATFKTYTVKAIVRDLNADGSPKGGETTWPGVVVTVLVVKPPSTANRAPKAVFSVTPLEGFVGDVFDFDARNSSDPDTGDTLRYRWVFGDGKQTEFTTNPRTTHSYAAPGSYVARLTVRDEANASTDATQTVRVLTQGENRSPVAMIATGPRAGSAPLTLTLDGRISFDPDGDAITYSWEFRQNGELIDTMTGSVVTRVFDTPGEYTVELVVTDVAGAVGRTEPQSILVTEPSAPPPPEPPPPRPQPQEPPDSSSQRPSPTTACGVGMLPGLLASLMGLTLTAATRRRWRN